MQAWHHRDGMGRDAGYALRSYARSPTFVASVVVSLAIGIGVVLLVFAVVRSWLLAPLPYDSAKQLALVWATNPRVGQPRDVISGPTFLDLQRQNTSFSRLAAFTVTELTIRTRDGAESIPRLEVTPDFLDLLGIVPALGRRFSADDLDAGAGSVAMLGYDFWQTRFGGDASVIGRPLSESGRPHVIVGVLPRGFTFFESPAVVTLLRPQDLERESRAFYYYWVVGRLKPGGDVTGAERELDDIMRRVTRDVPGLQGWEVRVEPLTRVLAEPVRSPLLMLLAACALVLIIAYANVANLLITRLVEREAELALRTTLGAEPSQVRRQLFVETALLVGIGGGLGMGLAAGGLQALGALLPGRVAIASSAAMLALPPVVLDATVIAFGLGLIVATWMVFSLVQTAKARVTVGTQGLDRRTTTASPGIRRARQTLVTTQTAFATTLLVIAGLLLQTVVRLANTSPGFETTSVMTMVVGQIHEMDAAARARYYTNILERVLATPGVAAAGLNDYIPLTNEDDYENFEIEGRPLAAPGQAHREEWRRVSASYFSSIAIPLVRGRDFTEHDDATAPSVTIVNQTMARKYWPNEDPIGRRIRIHGGAYGWSEIVGIVRDVREVGLDVAPKPMFFVPYYRAPRPVMGLFVRTTESPERLVEPIRRAIWAVDPTRPIGQLDRLANIVSNSFSVRQMALWLAAGLAGVAALLTAVGIYGVVSLAASQRTREIGIRMALGARALGVLWLVVRQGMTSALIGLVVGLGLAAFATPAIQEQLYEISAGDPFTYLLAALAVAGTAVAASLLPARRAAAIDPVTTLRHQ